MVTIVSMTRASQVRGFTLIELLVAVMIFLVLSVMAYGGLNIIMQGQQRFETNADQLAALQTFFMLISRDVEQVLDRPIRDNYGDELAPVHSDGRQFEITRAGLRNPAALARSHLQRVAYQLEDNKLYRFSWSVLDRAQDSEPYKSLVLSDVAELQLRFLNEKKVWGDQWPQAVSLDDLAETIPRAMEVVVDVGEWGRITRLFVLPVVQREDKRDKKV